MLYIHIPIDNFLSFTAPVQVVQFYKNLVYIINSEKIKYELIYALPCLSNEDQNWYITYHTKCKFQNVLNIKVSYHPDYFYMDKSGFSGWAELAESKEMHDFIDCTVINHQLLDTIKDDYKKNISKYRQPDIDNTINLYRNYIFIPLQVSDDSVLELARFSIYENLSEICKLITSQGYEVIIKVHPKELKYIISQVIKKVQYIKNVVVLNLSVHQLIQNCQGVLTVNSGVGFEALCYGKPVFVTGKSDYEYASYSMFSIEDLYKIKMYINQHDYARTTRFVSYFFEQYLVKYDNIKIISERIKLWQKYI